MFCRPREVLDSPVWKWRVGKVWGDAFLIFLSFPSFSLLFISIYLFLTIHSTPPKILKARLLRHRLASSRVSPMFLRGRHHLVRAPSQHALATRCYHLESTRGLSSFQGRLPKPPKSSSMWWNPPHWNPGSHWCAFLQTQLPHCPPVPDWLQLSLTPLNLGGDTLDLSLMASLSVTPRTKLAQTRPVVALDYLTSPPAVWKT